MKKLLKRACSIFLAVLMLTLTPMIALAQGQFDMSLSTSETCYAGITYDVVATITNLTASAVIGDENTESAFEWITDNGSPINSTNDYRITDNGDGTFTVTETAKVVLPSEVGTTIVSAEYGTSASDSIEINTLQPITSVNVSGVSDEGLKYYYKKSNDTSNDTLYIDSYVNSANFGAAYLNIDVNPANHEDGLVISSDTKYVSSNVEEDGSLQIKFTNASAVENSTLTISPQSGYGYTKKISLVECTALTQFKLKANSLVIATAVTSEGFSDESWGGTTTIAGESLTISPTETKPTGTNNTANDTYDYKLYTNSSLSTLAPSNYYSQNSDGSCSFNISNPGTYYLVCKAVSKGGYLQRDLTAYATITVNEANPITSISLMQIDENENITTEPLEEINLYTSTKKTYDVSKNLSIYPIGYTNDVKYSINDTTIATVSDAGIITAKKSGETTLYVYSDKDSNVVTSCKVNVKTEITAINSITDEDGKAVTLPAGHSIQLKANTTPAVTDETVRWSSQNTGVLTVSSAGYATANPDYDFGDDEYVDVQVTATSELGKQQSTYVRVIPAVSADTVTITAIDANKTDSAINSYTAYKGKSFTLNAEGKDSNGNASNDIYVWTVSIGDGSQMNFASAGDYFSYSYDEITDSYKITTKIAANYNFYCYAIKRGQSPTNETVFGSASVCVYETATNLKFINPSTGASYTSATISTGASIDIGVSMSPISAYEEDYVTYTSDNESVATVVKTSSQTATITAQDIQGTAKITAKTASGSKTATFTVTVTNNINFAEVSGVEASYDYTGYAINPVPQVSYNGLSLVQGVDYTLTYTDAAGATGTKCLNSGIASITITGKGNFAASSKTVYFEIKPKALASENVAIASISTALSGGSTVNGVRYYVITDTNSAPVPTLTIKDADRSGATLALNKDYTVECINNTTSGVATAVITGMGNYTGSYTISYNVCDNISKATVAKFAGRTYTGAALTPSPVVTYNGATLKKDIDYKVSYKNNTNIGVATVTITGIAPTFTGTTTVTFNIIPKTVTGVKTSARTYSSITLAWKQDTTVTGYQIYDVAAKKVIKTITDNKTVTYKRTSLSAQKAYSYRIRAYKTVNGVNYYGAYSAVVYSYTLPKTPAVTLKTGSRYITASWTKNTSVSGYQYQYSTSSKFTKAKTYTLSNTATSKKITGLTKGKKYYVRVRSYKKLKVNGKTVTAYSAWSTKSIVCK